MPQLKELLTELHTVNTKWHELGILLDIPSYVLDRIRADHRGSTKDCFREMAQEWLATGTASWQVLREALMNPTVRASKLAKELRIRHSSETSTGGKLRVGLMISFNTIGCYFVHVCSTYVLIYI